MSKSTFRFIDTVNDRLGRVVGWLLIPIMLIIVVDVVLRYFFHAPLIWSWDINIQLQGTVVLLGGGYVLLHKGHVSVDIIVSSLSTRKKALADAVTHLLVIISVSLLLWPAILYAWNSVRIRECFTSALLPPIYPFKVLIVVGVLLLLLQGVSEIRRFLVIALHGEGK